MLDGDYIYDYQGRLTVDDLSHFIKDKDYLKKSKPRQILHMQSAWENLVNALHVTKLKLRAFTLLLFRAVGLGHLEEQFIFQVVYVCMITPMVIFFIALFIESRQIKTRQEQEAKN